MIGRTPGLATFPNVSNLWKESVKGQGGECWIQLTYLVIKHEEVIIERQGSCADLHVLELGLVLGLSSTPVTKRTCGHLKLSRRIMAHILDLFCWAKQGHHKGAGGLRGREERVVRLLVIVLYSTQVVLATKLAEIEEITPQSGEPWPCGSDKLKDAPPWESRLPEESTDAVSRSNRSPAAAFQRKFLVSGPETQAPATDLRRGCEAG